MNLSWRLLIHWSSVSSSSSPPGLLPAQVTRMSTCPSASMAAFMVLSTSAWTLMSPANGSTLPPVASLSSSAAVVRRSSSRAVMATSHPSSARMRVVSRPIPLLPPVTTAFRPAKPRSISVLSLPACSLDDEELIRVRHVRQELAAIARDGHDVLDLKAVGAGGQEAGLGSEHHVRLDLGVAVAPDVGLLVDEEPDAVPDEAHRLPAQLPELVRDAGVDLRAARPAMDRLPDQVSAAHDVRPDLLGARGALLHDGRAADAGVVAVESAEHLEPDQVAPPQLAQRRTHVRELAALAAPENEPLEVLGPVREEVRGDGAGEVHLRVARVDALERLLDRPVRDAGEAPHQVDLARRLPEPQAVEDRVRGAPVHPREQLNESLHVAHRQVVRLDADACALEPLVAQQSGEHRHRVLGELLPHLHVHVRL